VSEREARRRAAARPTAVTPDAAETRTLLPATRPAGAAAFVRRLKGPDRPVTGQDDRAELLAALPAVDHVAVFQGHPRRRAPAS